MSEKKEKYKVWCEKMWSFNSDTGFGDRVYLNCLGWVISISVLIR